MKYFIAFVILFSAPTINAQTLKTFSNPAIPFTAKYPATWENKIDETKRVFFTSPLENAADTFRQNVNVGITYNKKFGTTLKLKDAVASMVEQLQQSFDEFEMQADQKYFKWNGVDAFEIVYTGASQGMQAKLIQWFAFSKGRMFIATYAATEEDNDAFETTARNIMKSIVFK